MNKNTAMNETLNQLDSDFINDLDNVSLTETDGLSVRGKCDARLAYAKTNAYILKITFAKYEEFDEYDEEDLIFAIQDSENIDWNEVSMMPKLPEFIMEEFHNKINWFLVALNRRMTLKTIKRFEKNLFGVTNNDLFLSKLDDSNTHALNIILSINNNKVKLMFTMAYRNNYNKMISILINHYNIGTLELLEAFKFACKGGNASFISILIDNPAIRRHDISEEFKDACASNNESTIDILSNSGLLTREIITNALRNIVQASNPNMTNRLRELYRNVQN
jgi:hypothetical protein